MGINKLYDVIVVGGGVSGCAALSWLSRSRTKALVVDENLLEPEEAPSAKAEDVLLGRKQKAIDLKNVDSIAKNAVLITYMHGLFLIYLEDGQMVCSRSVALATGKKAITPPILAKNAASGTAVIVGGGNYAIDFANALLKRGCERVVICDKEIDSGGRPSKIQKLLDTKKAEILPNCAISSVVDDADRKIVKLTTTAEIEADSIFYLEGAQPQTKFVSFPFVNKDESGYIIAPRLRALVPGLFAVGSCRRGCIGSYADGKNAAAVIQAFLAKEQAV